LGLHAATWAVLISLAITVVLAAVEIVYQSKASIRDFGGPSFLFYYLVSGIGNILTTLFAFLILSKKLPSEITPWFPYIYSFFGIFAFEGVLRNTNVNFLDRGVLTIQDWVIKARDPAVATAVQNQVQRGQNFKLKSASILATLDEITLNTYIAQFLGSEVVTNLEAAAKASGADVKLYKGLELASKAPSETESILKNLKRRS
jgi:hypothetical protein